jgi:hypothetical protein
MRDARAIADGVADLDWPYLEKWARRLYLKELLDEVRA